MNPLLHPAFVSPECNAELELLASGNHQCSEHGASTLNHGLSSFSNATHFDQHWTENFADELPDAKKDVARNFLRPFFDWIKDKQDVILLDAGCGDGVHAEVMQELVSGKNLKATGIDISLSALLASQKRKSNGWRFVHADVGRLPFPDRTFDASFSFGVLAYTENPKESLREMRRVTKSGGIIGVWIYPKSEGLGGFAFSTVRAICRITGSIGTNFIANLIVPFLGMMPTNSKLSLKNATWKQCKEVVLVNIAPQDLIFPTEDEVKGWFRELDLKLIPCSEQEPITLWARR